MDCEGFAGFKMQDIMVNIPSTNEEVDTLKDCQAVEKHNDTVEESNVLAKSSTEFDVEVQSNATDATNNMGIYSQKVINPILF